MVNRVLAMLGVGTDEAVPEDLSPDEVKQRVADEIAPRMAQPFAGIDEAQDYLDKVYRRFQPAGLKSLVLRPKDAKDNEFDIVAAASAEQDVGNLVVNINVIAPKEGEIRYGGLDNMGRASKAYGWLTNTANNRDIAAQTLVSQNLNSLMETWGLETRFDAGHLIAARYGGAGGAENLVPQERRSNRSWWKAFENAIAKEVAANGPGELVYAEVRAVYTADPFERIVTEDDLAGTPSADRSSLEAALLHVPDSIYMERLGRRKVDGTEEALNPPGQFDVRSAIQSLGRSLKGVVGGPFPKGFEL